jgi:hypothetical protein
MCLFFCSEQAHLDQLDTYLELMYEEDMSHKIRGTSLILQLVQDPDNLNHFIENDTVLGALARVLQEDRKKNTELITNILEIFFCFSSFTQLHQILLQNKIGDTTIKIIELEIKRYDLRIDKKKDVIEPEFLQQQERLLFVCFYILLNMAEDVNIELKMKSRKIMKHLIKMLKRTNPDHMFLDELHLLIITFLKKLSIFDENKSEMIEYDIIRHLLPFLNIENEDLLESNLRLLYNLTFDHVQREKMVKYGLIDKCVQIIKRSGEGPRKVSIRFLYSLSMDSRFRTQVDLHIAPIMQFIISLIIRSPTKLIEKELAALAINLTWSKKLVQQISIPEIIHHLIKRVHQTFDPLLIKIVRNIAQLTEQPILFKRYLHEIVGMTLKAPSHEFLVESIGVLNNIVLPDGKQMKFINNILIFGYIQIC